MYRQPKGFSRYVLVTAVKNERDTIALVLRAVLNQTLKPLRWVIVSDGSTDGTDEIVRAFAANHPFIELYRAERSATHRCFAGKVDALTMGIDRVKDVPFDCLGILDGDVTFGSDYYERTLRLLEQNPGLGLVGGYIHERDRSGKWRARGANRPYSVAGAVQLFTRECFLATGGFVPLPFGGEDTLMAIRAMMNGYGVRSFPDLEVRHHHDTGSRLGFLRKPFILGRKEASLGYLSLFEVLVCALRMLDAPPLLGALIRFAGYLAGRMDGAVSVMPRDAAEFLRAEQRRRMLELRNPFRRPFVNPELAGSAAARCRARVQPSTPAS